MGTLPFYSRLKESIESSLRCSDACASFADTRSPGSQDASSWLFEKLSAEIKDLDLDTALPLIRVFTHYLNLTV